MTSCILVFIGGGIGSLCRYGLQHAGFANSGTHLYTLTANLTGCLLIGIVWAILNARHADQMWNALLITGILGGYTTFSAFSLDTMHMIQAGRILPAIGYVALSVIGGIALCGIGLYSAQRIIRIFS